MSFPATCASSAPASSSFLAEVARPSQIGVNPFLRGFFFAGMRAHMVEDVLDIGPAQPQNPPPRSTPEPPASFPSPACRQPQEPAPQTRRRRHPQGPTVGLSSPPVYSKILLADKSALEASRASTRTSFLKRTLLAGTCGDLS